MADSVSDDVAYHCTANTFSILHFADRLHGWYFRVIEDAVSDEAGIKNIWKGFVDSSMPSEQQERIVSPEGETAYRLDLD